jgi:hypothetical protein
MKRTPVGAEADHIIAGDGGWHNPKPEEAI